MNENIYDKIFIFIDKKMCYEHFKYKKNIKDLYHNILFRCQELRPNDTLNLYEEDKGKFISKDGVNNILIHRFDNNKPNVSLRDEVVTLLHEYGHYVSLQKGDKVKKSETNYNYELNDNLQKKIIIKEEINAWIYGFKEINNLPINLIEKFLIKFFMLKTAPCSLYGYIMYNEGIVD